MRDAWLMQPAPEGARVVGLHLLEQAGSARARLASREEDREALHDFRVALRRLRSWLRAFRPELEDTMSGKTRRRLGRIADATGAGRDLEVLLALLARLRPASVAERRAQAALEASLRARGQEAEAGLASAESAFDETMPDVERALSSWLLPVGRAAANGRGPEPLASALARRIDAQAEALGEALAAAGTPDRQAEAHAARIAGKRLRYLLEPIAGRERAAKDVVKRLKALQDLLGDMHDAHVLELEAARLVDQQDLPPAGVRALQGRAQRRVMSLHAALRRDWLRSQASETLEAARGVARALAETAGEGIEHERKFLLSGLPARARRGRRSLLEQGWLPGTALVERVRRERSAGGTRYLRTIKAGRGISRIEAEEETTARLFRGLWPLTEGRRVRKERYAVRSGGLVWEIDNFLDRDLVLAEVELPSADAPAPIPSWLAPHVVREVTGDDAYVNRNLAR